MQDSCHLTQGVKKSEELNQKLNAMTREAAFPIRVLLSARKNAGIQAAVY